MKSSVRRESRALADQEISLATAIPWTVKGTLAALDQGLFAGAHFFLNVLLARWLPAAEYGAFALAYSVFLLLAAFHTAGFVEPMLVFGAGKYDRTFKTYFRLLLKGHVAFSVLLGLILACVAALVGYWSSELVAHALYVLVFTGPALLLLWMVRRAFYVDLRPSWSATGGGFYLVLLLGLVYGLRFRSWLSPSSALSAMGAVAVAVSLALVVRTNWWEEEAASELRASDVLKSHWDYGRWSVAAAAVAWFPGNIYYVFLPVWGGLKSVAALRALANLVSPPVHALMALATLLLALLVRQRESGGKKAMTRVMLISLGVFLFGATLYLATLWFFRAEAFRVLYGGRYEEYGRWPLFLLGLYPLSVCLTSVLGVALMAMERPERNFWSFVMAALAAAVVGIPLTAMMGLAGAALGMLLGNLSAATAMYVSYRRSTWEGKQVVAAGHGAAPASLKGDTTVAMGWGE